MDLQARINEANQALIVRGELDTVPDFFSADYLVHLTDLDVQRGHKMVRDTLAALRRSFVDLQVDIEILLAGTDRIAWQRTLHGAHEVAFKGFPGNGKRLVWRDMVTSRFEDGRIAEEWVLSDLAEQLLLARKG